MFYPIRDGHYGRVQSDTLLHVNIYVRIYDSMCDIYIAHILMGNVGSRISYPLYILHVQ